MRILMELNGTPDESPQLTHRWNNHHLSEADVAHLDPDRMVKCDGIAGVRNARSLFKHIPVAGWRNYVVVEPYGSSEAWHAGWIVNGLAGVSRISLRGKARLLLGPDAVRFFGIAHATNQQIPVMRTGFGRLGDGGEYKNVPLL